MSTNKDSVMITKITEYLKSILNYLSENQLGILSKNVLKALKQRSNNIDRELQKRIGNLNRYRAEFETCLKSYQRLPDEEATQFKTVVEQYSKISPNVYRLYRTIDTDIKKLDPQKKRDMMIIESQKKFLNMLNWWFIFVGRFLKPGGSTQTRNGLSSFHPTVADRTTFNHISKQIAHRMKQIASAKSMQLNNNMSNTSVGRMVGGANYRVGGHMSNQSRPAPLVGLPLSNGHSPSSVGAISPITPGAAVMYNVGLVPGVRAGPGGVRTPMILNLSSPQSALPNGRPPPPPGPPPTKAGSGGGKAVNLKSGGGNGKGGNKRATYRRPPVRRAVKPPAKKPPASTRRTRGGGRGGQSNTKTKRGTRQSNSSTGKAKASQRGRAPPRPPSKGTLVPQRRGGSQGRSTPASNTSSTSSTQHLYRVSMPPLPNSANSATGSTDLTNGLRLPQSADLNGTSVNNDLSGLTIRRGAGGLAQYSYSSLGSGLPTPSSAGASQANSTPSSLTPLLLSAASLKQNPALSQLLPSRLMLPNTNRQLLAKSSAKRDGTNRTAASAKGPQRVAPPPKVGGPSTLTTGMAQMVLNQKRQQQLLLQKLKQSKGLTQGIQQQNRQRKIGMLEATRVFSKAVQSMRNLEEYGDKSDMNEHFRMIQEKLVNDEDILFRTKRKGSSRSFIQTMSEKKSKQEGGENDVDGENINHGHRLHLEGSTNEKSKKSSTSPSPKTKGLAFDDQTYVPPERGQSQSPEKYPRNLVLTKSSLKVQKPPMEKSKGGEKKPPGMKEKIEMESESMDSTSSSSGKITGRKRKKRPEGFDKVSFISFSSVIRRADVDRLQKKRKLERTTNPSSQTTSPSLKMKMEQQSHPQYHPRAQTHQKPTSTKASPGRPKPSTLGMGWDGRRIERRDQPEEVFPTMKFLEGLVDDDAEQKRMKTNSEDSDNKLSKEEDDDDESFLSFDFGDDEDEDKQNLVLVASSQIQKSMKFVERRFTFDRDSREAVLLNVNPMSGGRRLGLRNNRRPKKRSESSKSQVNNIDEDLDDDNGDDEQQQQQRNRFLEDERRQRYIFSTRPSIQQNLMNNHLQCYRVTRKNDEDDGMKDEDDDDERYGMSRKNLVIQSSGNIEEDWRKCSNLEKMMIQIETTLYSLEIFVNDDKTCKFRMEIEVSQGLNEFHITSVFEKPKIPNFKVSTKIGGHFRCSGMEWIATPSDESNNYLYRICKSRFSEEIAMDWKEKKLGVDCFYALKVWVDIVRKNSNHVNVL